MGIGSGLLFVAIGAILAFATNFHLSGLNLQMIGWILIIIGLAMLVITFAYTRPRRRRQQVVEQVDVVDGQPQPGAYMSQVEEPPTVVEQPVGPNMEEPAVRRTVRSRRFR